MSTVRVVPDVPGGLWKVVDADGSALMTALSSAVQARDWAFAAGHLTDSDVPSLLGALEPVRPSRVEARK